MLYIFCNLFVEYNKIIYDNLRIDNAPIALYIFEFLTELFYTQQTDDQTLVTNTETNT